MTISAERLDELALAEAAAVLAASGIVVDALFWRRARVRRQKAGSVLVEV